MYTISVGKPEERNRDYRKGIEVKVHVIETQAMEVSN
jgi:hypothetical protein